MEPTYLLKETYPQIGGLRHAHLNEIDQKESEAEAKKKAAEYSLGLIKASIDHLSDTNTADVDKMMVAIIELNHSDRKTSKYPCSNEMLKELVKDHERIISELKMNLSNYYERFRDVSIVDRVKGIIEEHRTIAWILRKHMAR
ncbi:MAG: hypothetical protein M3R27_06345 [Bacteroidota bacterium]|nr:hypothetical protein [Bacteroidota bacterium]